MLSIVGISILLLLLEAWHDSLREKLEWGSYDEKLDYRTKLIKALALTVALGWFYYSTGNLRFPLTYVVLRALLFDLFYLYLSGRVISLRTLLSDNWIVKIIKLKIWR